MRIVHSNINPEMVEVKQKKRIPLYKDEAAIDRLVRQIFRENDERLDRLAQQKRKAL